MDFEEMNTLFHKTALDCIREEDEERFRVSLQEHSKVYFTSYAKGKKVSDVAKFFATGSSVESIKIETGDLMVVNCDRLSSDADMKRLKIFDEYQVVCCWIDVLEDLLVIKVEKKTPEEATEPKKKTKKK